MVLAQISIVPVGTSTTSMGDYIADAIRVLEKAGVPYDVSAVGTLFEGSPKDVFRSRERCTKRPSGEDRNGS